MTKDEKERVLKRARAIGLSFGASDNGAEQISIRVPNGILRELNELSSLLDVSRSKLIVDFIQKGLKDLEA